MDEPITRRGLPLGAAIAMALLATPARANLVFFTDFSSFDAASDTTIVEDFENVFPRSTPLSSFVSQGNRHIGLAGIDLLSQPFPNVYLAPPGATSFMVGTPTTSTVLTANGDEDIRVELGSPVTAVGFDTDNAVSPATVEVIGAGGSLGTVILNAAPNQVGFLGFVSTDPIAGFRWTTGLGAIVDTGFDNVRLGSMTAVPEPLSVLILGVGFLGMLVASGLRRGTGQGRMACSGLREHGVCG
jgi:hypothetical protein